MAAKDLPSGPDLVEEIGQENTLDLIMQRDPREVTDEQWMEAINFERQQRAMFIKSEQEKREKKRSGE